MSPASVRIFVCTEPQDMRGSFDRLALLAREILGQDPRSGALFCFVNKRMNRLKVLWWDKTGYCILYKRMHGALVELPRSDGRNSSVCLDVRQLQALLAGSPKTRQRRKKHLTTERIAI
jgi:transposase